MSGLASIALAALIVVVGEFRRTASGAAKPPRGGKTRLGQGSRMNVGSAAELTHEKLTVERDAGFGSCKSSPELKGAAVSKPQRLINGPAQLPERFDA